MENDNTSSIILSLEHFKISVQLNAFVTNIWEQYKQEMY
jgi:hypothetical protein